MLLGVHEEVEHLDAIFPRRPKTADTLTTTSGYMKMTGVALMSLAVFAVNSIGFTLHSTTPETDSYWGVGGIGNINSFHALDGVNMV